MEASFAPEDPSLLRTALLIDAATFPVEAAEPLFATLTQYAEITIKRAFANWSKPEMRPWAERLALFAIVPFQRFDYPQDSAVDVDITIEALDLLKNRKIEAFALATGSGALGRLAIRLREAGAVVYGFAQSPAASGPFRTACSYFWSVDDLFSLRENTEMSANNDEDLMMPVWDDASDDSPLSMLPPSADDLTKFRELLKLAVAENEADDGWALLSSIGSTIKTHWPSFNPTDLGYKNMKNMVEDSKDIVRINNISPFKVRLLDDFS
jgi:hypothetical protein